MLKAFFLVLFIVYSHYIFAIQDTTIVKKRFKKVIIAESVIYAGSMIAFDRMWYRDFERTGFHFFDDSNQWLQMDKAGHFFSAWQLASLNAGAFEWSGLSVKKSVLLSSGVALGLITSIEVFDGFSAAWGASLSDLVANLSGILLFATQEMVWKEQRIVPKYSFHSTRYSKIRPEALGSGFSSLSKDYNGATYWLSVNIKSFTKWNVPRWFNIAFGYSATGMTGGKGNYLAPGIEYLPDFRRKRQFYLSFDVDFTKFESKCNFIKLMLRILNMIKVPFPAIEYTSNSGLKLKYLYF